MKEESKKYIEDLVKNSKIVEEKKEAENPFMNVNKLIKKIYEIVETHLEEIQEEQKNTKDVQVRERILDSCKKSLQILTNLLKFADMLNKSEISGVKPEMEVSPEDLEILANFIERVENAEARNI